MTVADIIALAIIFFMLFCSIRYMIVSHKKGGCSGCCSDCGKCRERNGKNE